MDACRQTLNKVNTLSIKVKREFFTNTIASQNGDLKSAWKTINMVLNKKLKTTQIASLEVYGSLISDSKSVAESINNFFCSIGNALSGMIPETPYPLLNNEYLVKPQDLPYQFKAINVCQLEKIFGSFKTSKISGADGIATYF